MKMNGMSRLKLAELTSGIGALVLGVGLGARFGRLFSSIAIPILVIGIVMHAWGMFDKNRIEKGAGTLPRFELYLYWVCWILLLALAAYLVFSKS